MRTVKKHYRRIFTLLFMVLSIWPFKVALAQDAECAEVRVIIEQKLSFERQAFDAKMLINNGLTSAKLENIRIELLFEDRNNQPVSVTEDANETEAMFFYKIDSLSGIENISGTGEIASKSSAEIHWLIIPAYGAAADQDKLYYVGAKVSYTLNGEETSVDVTPDYITVRPLPKLVLDYFFPEDVYGDDDFTTDIEPSIPFTLGVRVKNTGYGVANNTAIESAQPKIIDNAQNLLVNFEIIGGYVADQLIGKSLLLKLGDIPPNASQVGRWNVVTSLSGKFTEFTASYSHADGLGGKLTSLIDSVNTHTLVHDVKVDLPYRDNVRDFLAFDQDTLRVYESEGIDSEVSDLSSQSLLEAINGKYALSFPATMGLVYTKLADPFNGTRTPFNMQRSDGKVIAHENVWLSKERNEDLSWSYFIHLFDTNSTGQYQFTFTEITNKASLAGTVYNDTNDNGVFDESEKGIGVAAIQLTGIDQDCIKISTQAYTDNQGHFNFVGLNPGNYALQALPLNGLNDGQATTTVANATTQISKITDIQLAAGMQVDGNLFAKVSSEIALPQANAADLDIGIVSSTNTANVDDTVKYTVTLVNHGPNDAIDTSVDLSIPKNLRVYLISTTAGQVINSNGRWVINKIPSGASYTLQINTRVMQAAGNVPVTATITSQTADNNPTNNTATVTLLTTATAKLTFGFDQFVTQIASNY
ncbi:SdrD B-like domain-containing protein [Entomomonas asaccharolytica]|uniref:DUF11 domain-containing protein n=1 Tax=Entomomonas asaccharolytica TaxID=2785331 RepID=A0A974ND33_9GAMM|nr:SdrD B-like domain-containing protein [Entomomonas asaccharolytica]QQP84466.1 hypothetical protein JHT90_08520 [Entomomonas asaccharolytica]